MVCIQSMFTDFKQGCKHAIGVCYEGCSIGVLKFTGFVFVFLFIFMRNAFHTTCFTFYAKLIPDYGFCQPNIYSKPKQIQVFYLPKTILLTTFYAKFCMGQNCDYTSSFQSNVCRPRDEETTVTSFDHAKKASLVVSTVIHSSFHTSIYILS